jgi:hypothetical protein
MPLPALLDALHTGRVHAVTVTVPCCCRGVTDGPSCEGIAACAAAGKGDAPLLSQAAGHRFAYPGEGTTASDNTGLAPPASAIASM